MLTKIFKPALLTALIATANPALARDDLGSCYHPLMPYIDQSIIGAPQRELTILIDQTARFDDKLKKELLRKALEYIRRGDRITAASFSAYANKHYTELVFSGALDRPLPDTALKDIPIKHAKSYKRCLSTQWSKGRKLMAERILVATTSPGDEYDFSHTELVGTINTLTKDLLQKSKRRERILLIFSDMFENSHTTTFFSKGKVRQINPDTELAKIKKAGMIPDLTGIRIYVIGGGWLEDGSLYQDSRKIKALRIFWEKFFTAAGATLEGFGEPMLLTDIR